MNELPYLIAGHPRHPVTGTIRLPQRSGEWTDVADARKLGIPLVPADRAHEAIVPDFAVSENLTPLGTRPARVARQARQGG